MKIRADTLLVRIQYLTLLGIIVAQTLGQSAVSSLLFTVTFVWTACLWLATAYRSADYLSLLIVLLSGISVTINALCTGTEVSFSYFKKLIIFCCTILLFAAAGEYRPQRTDLALIFRGNTVLAVFLAVMYGWQRPQMYLLNRQITDYLTFRFTNPNLTAVFVAAVCMLEMIQTVVSKGKPVSLIHGILAGVTAYFVYETRARNAQLLLLFFLIFFLFVVLFPKSRPRMTLGMAVLIAGFPLVFALVYLLLIYMPEVQNLFSFLIGEGKDLDSRVGIWTYALQAFYSSPLFGAYSEISAGTGISQMHNSHLDILASYGCVVLGLSCAFLVRLLYGGNSGRIGFLCKMGFAALLLSGIGEAMLFSGGMGIYLYPGVFLMLANFHFEGEEPV